MTNKELVAWFDRWKHEGPTQEIKEARERIIHLIENRPEVDEQSVEKCVNRLSYWSKSERGLSEEFVRNRIQDLFDEAGVRVKK